MAASATKSERSEKVGEALKLLEAGVERIVDGEEFKRYLRFSSRFHHYSANNVLLILVQRPDAARVAGYKAWQKMGRQVRKGEKGIKILAPVSRAFEDEQTGEKARALVGFKIATVFDIAQTDGEPVPAPPMPEDLDPEDPAGIARGVYEGLTRLCEAEGVAVELEDRQRGDYGSYHRKERRIVLNRSLSGMERATTLTHELAHHFLHQEDGRTRAARETEAEGVSFALFSYFGLDTSHFSFAYVARHAKEPQVLRAALERIQATTRRLIAAIEPPPEEERMGGRP